MLNHLKVLYKKRYLSPLSYYFATFIADQESDASDILLLSAALVSEQNLKGDVCIDLKEHVGKELFSLDNPQLPLDERPELQKGFALTDWKAALETSRLVANSDDDIQPFILSADRLYLRKHYMAESFIYRAIQTRIDNPPEIDELVAKEGLNSLFATSTVNTAAEQGSPTEPNWQQLACATALRHKFSVISGGPGTGKTTTVIKVLALLLKQDGDMIIHLAAPTGKAAARMTDSIIARIQDDRNIQSQDKTLINALPTEATTLHRLLGSTGHGFSYNKNNKLVLDCLVIDEASMIDQSMMTKVLEAIPDEARVILLGDRDQLASVEAGNVLGDITGHGNRLVVSTIEANKLEALTGIKQPDLFINNNLPAIANTIALLRKSYRFSEDSGIGKLAALVNDRNAEAAFDFITNDETNKVSWIEGEENTLSKKVITLAVEQYSRFLKEDNVDNAYTAFESFRVLCALKKGDCGVEEINRRIVKKLIEAEDEKVRITGGEDGYHKMPIMVTVNDYENNLFNGDIGLVWRNETTKKLEVHFKFGTQSRKVPLSTLSNYVPAWALSIHKSQGSEFNEVMLVLPADAASPILSKELIYTGITRAKQNIIIHASKASFIKGCGHKVDRASGLAIRLGWS